MGQADDVEVTAPRTCAVCGVTGGSDDLTWSISVEAGRRRAVCPACTRANVRSIEGKLAEEWW